jgi:hypothetical protein
MAVVVTVEGYGRLTWVILSWDRVVHLAKVLDQIRVQSLRTYFHSKVLVTPLHR